MSAPVLYVLGTSGFAKEVAQLATDINAAEGRWRAIEYLCQHEAEVGKAMPFGQVTSTDDYLRSITSPCDVVIGIGRPAIRRRIAATLVAHPLLRTPNLIHPAAGIDLRHVRLGQGNVITKGAMFTCDIEVGDFNVFNLNCTVGHDCRIGSYNVINPGCNISGGCTLANACLLGTGCQLLEGLAIAEEVTIGAGALVARSILDPSGVHVGVPAKPLQR